MRVELFKPISVRKNNYFNPRVLNIISNSRARSQFEILIIPKTEYLRRMTA